jgi:sugar lactone lactonase YvrE
MHGYQKKSMVQQILCHHHSHLHFSGTVYMVPVPGAIVIHGSKKIDMKKKLNLFVLILLTGLVPVIGMSQSVGINTDGSNPDPSSILDIKSSAKGVLIPRMTATQRTAINNPSKGLLVFQTDPVPSFCYYNGLAWVNLGTGDEMNNTGFSVNYGLVSTFAGSGDPSGIQDGVGTSATFGFTLGLAADKKGNLYVTAESRHSVRKITASGIVSTLAGATLTPGYVDGSSADARFNKLIGLVTDSTGNIYTTEFTHLIRKITPTGIVTTIAGDPLFSTSVDGDSTAAHFRTPYGITTDASGNLYVADRDDYMIRKIDTNKKVTTIGGVSSVTGFVNTAANTGYTLFNQPSGIVADKAGNLYISDQGNHVIRKIDPSGNVTTLAGTGTSGNTDGPSATASFNMPEGIVIDAGGTIYIADRGNHNIRKITPAGIVSTIAGAGSPGYLDGSDISALFHDPSGLALDPQGNLYVADNSNGRIRKISLH